MPPALRYLMRLQLRGTLRQGLRRAKTPRGAVFFALGVGVVLLWLTPAVLSAHMTRPPPEHVRNLMPLVILGIALLSTFTSAGEQAIAFTGGETDFLFPGPFTRRQLMLYKLFKGTAVAALTALLVSVAIFRNATFWVACYLGCFFTLLFIQFFSTAVLLVGQRFGSQMKSHGRLLVIAAAFVLAVVLVHAALGGRGWDTLMTDPRYVLQRLARTGAGQVILAPFYVLTQVITAERLWPDLPMWAAAAAAIDLALVAVIVRLDRFFVETAAGASERRYERLRRFRSGGGLANIPANAARRSVPLLPRMGGAGAIAWRQLTHALRASRSLIFVLLILAVAIGPLMVASARANDPTSVVAPIVGAVVWISVLLASVLRFDFRADLDTLETLKAMPLRPTAVAAGQIIAPSLVLTLVHFVVIGATIAATWNLPLGRQAIPILLLTAVLALPFNALMLTAENLIFLLAPSRPASSGPGDFSVLGRQIFTLIIRAVGVGIAAGVAAVAAVLVYVFTDNSLVAATAVAFVVLCAEVAAMVPLLGYAYRRFDPSVHMPG